MIKPHKIKRVFLTLLCFLLFIGLIPSMGNSQVSAVTPPLPELRFDDLLDDFLREHEGLFRCDNCGGAIYMGENECAAFCEGFKLRMDFAEFKQLIAETIYRRHGIRGYVEEHFLLFDPGQSYVKIGGHLFLRYYSDSVIKGADLEYALRKAGEAHTLRAYTAFFPFFVPPPGSFRHPDLWLATERSRYAGILGFGWQQSAMIHPEGATNFQYFGGDSALQDLITVHGFSSVRNIPDFSFNLDFTDYFTTFNCDNGFLRYSMPYFNISAWRRANGTLAQLANHGVNNAGDFGAPTWVRSDPFGESSAFLENGTYGIFHVPPGIFSNGNEFFAYLGTLTPADFTQNLPNSAKIELPEPFVIVLEEADDDDDIEIIIDPDTGGITFVVIRHGVGGNCCCCGYLSQILGYLRQILETIHGGFVAVIAGIGNIMFPDIDITFDDSRILSYLREILTELRGGFNKVVDAIADISVDMTNYFWDNSYHEAGDNRPWWQRLMDSTAGMFSSGGDFFSGLGDAFSGFADIIRAIFEPLFNFLGGFFDSLIDFTIKMFVPSADLLEGRFTEFHVKIDEKFPIIAQSQEIIDDFLEVVEHGPRVLGADTKTGTDFKSAYMIDYENVNGVNVPVFYATFRGEQYRFFDFIWFEPYRHRMHALIIAIFYIVFAFSIFKRVVEVLNGQIGAHRVLMENTAKYE
jgi:hypothetical protein